MKNRLAPITLLLAAVACICLVNAPVRALVESQAFGIFGVTPVATQPSGAAEAAVTKTAGAALATTAVTLTTPYGFATQAQGDLVTTRLNQLVADNAALIVLVNEQRAVLVSLGLMKGAP